MGRPRYQHPSVKRTHPKHGRARWFIRVMVDVLIDRGRTDRKERTIYLGFCDEMGKREAEKARDAQGQPTTTRRWSSRARCYSRTWLRLTKRRRSAA
jgi:hypothetical protein